MKELLTPKEVANAIRVSESSVKRWCDSGVIPARYTAGGHRRIPLSGLIDFLRSSKHQLVRPEVIGLPTATGTARQGLSEAQQCITAALLSGDEEQCRRVTLDLYLSEHSVAVICDKVLPPAFREIGDRWQCGEAEVYQERLGCEITLRVLHELRHLIPPAPDDAPLAIGGAPAGDEYNLATTMAELVLADGRWRAISLGDNLPFHTLAAAIRQHRPQLFWLSCSYLADEETFQREYAALQDEFGLDVPFVVGGRALVEPLRQRMTYSAYCDTMQHLESFAQTLRQAAGG